MDAGLCKSPRATVLVVDDSHEMRRYLQFLLEMDSYQVETACDGREAVERLRGGYSPAVTLLDFEMPGLDGLATLRQLRALKPDMKVIMCSGIDDPEHIRRAVSLGVQAYLTKPVQHLYLSAAVERCLTQGGEPDVAREQHARVLTMPAAPMA